MNNFDTMILNPHPVLARRNSEGHLIELAHTGKAGYLSVDDFDRLAAEGKITIHVVGGNEVAAAYGRIQVAYTINN